jgi:hypothetical protein
MSFSDNTSLNIFDKQVDGNVYFRNPRIEFTVHNSFGVPVTARISNLRIIRGNGQTLYANIDQLQDTFSFPYPKSGLQRDIVSHSYTVDTTNSQHPGRIDDLFNAGPQRLLYDMEFTANYAEEVQDNLLLDNSLFFVDSEVQLPMEMIVKNYVMASNEKNGMAADTGEVTVESATMTLFSENNLAMAGRIQVYFGLDTTLLGVDTFIVADSLYDNPAYVPRQPLVYIGAARIDANGKVVSPEVALNTTMLTGDRWRQLAAHKNIRIWCSLETSSIPPGSPNQPFVKFYSDQKLYAKLGADLHVRYRSKEK